MNGQLSDLSKFRITPTHKFDFDDMESFPTNLRGISDAAALKVLDGEKLEMEVQQEMLHASKSNGFLLVIQAMDAAGKDSAVKHALAGLNVVGTRAVSFGAPTPTELKEDMLDRHTRALPKLGEFGIWVRSHYEEVGILRVHPELLKKRTGPSSPEGTDMTSVNQEFWDNRIEQIRKWEQQRVQDNIHIVKIFLNACDKVRMSRLLDRTEKPDKFWKVNPEDIRELDFMPQYKEAYQQAINATSTKSSPWYVVPADDKPIAHALVAKIVNHELVRLDLSYPTYSGQALQEIRNMRAELKKRLNFKE